MKAVRNKRGTLHFDQAEDSDQILRLRNRMWDTNWHQTTAGIRRIAKENHEDLIVIFRPGVSQRIAESFENINHDNAKR